MEWLIIGGIGLLIFLAAKPVAQSQNQNSAQASSPSRYSYTPVPQNVVVMPSRSTPGIANDAPVPLALQMPNIQAPIFLGPPIPSTLPSPQSINGTMSPNDIPVASYSPGTIQVPGQPDPLIRTTPEGLTAAQATMQAGLGAVVPAIGQYPSNSSLWSNLSLGNNQWRWSSIDGSNLNFISDASGRRIA